MDIERYIEIGKEIKEDYLYIYFHPTKAKFIVSYNPFLSWKYITAKVIDIRNNDEKTFYNFSLENADIEFDWESIRNREDEND